MNKPGIETAPAVSDLFERRLKDSILRRAIEVFPAAERDDLVLQVDDLAPAGEWLDDGEQLANAGGRHGRSSLCTAGAVLGAGHRPTAAQLAPRVARGGAAESGALCRN